MTTASESAAVDTEAGEGIRPPEPAPEDSTIPVIGAVEEWLLSLRAAFARAVDITVLEARLAALNFSLIVIVAVASGLLLASAWIALFAAIVAWIHELGLSWSSALLLMAVINLTIAVIGGYAIYRMSNNLLFKAIRKFIIYEEDNAKSTAGDAPPAQ